MKTAATDTKVTPLSESSGEGVKAAAVKLQHQGIMTHVGRGRIRKVSVKKQKTYQMEI